MRWILVVVTSLLVGCASEPPAPEAFIAVSSNAKSGSMQITAIDGKPVADSDGTLVPAGTHHLQFSCKLDNGIGATFATDTELLANHSYCFFSSNQGKSCQIMYTQVAWDSGALVSCN